MKVSISKDIFAPITIVIETEEEAKHLWHSLNVPPGAVGTVDPEYETPIEVSQEMWGVFNKVYHPDGL